MYPFPCPALNYVANHSEWSPRAAEYNNRKHRIKKQLQTPLQKLQQQLQVGDDDDGTGEEAATPAADKIEETAKTTSM